MQYLTSQLVKLNLNDWKIYLIVGCVWAAWHIPYYLVFLPEADIQAVMPVSRAVYAVVAFITLLSWAVMFTELFRVTKSVWPCILMHMVEDSLVNLLVISHYISIATGKEILVSPINGIITSILYVAVGLGIRAYRIRANQILIG
ncbi:CPBP family glutamic-type intramembrane protease [Pelotomaculum propionicicum]|uniref:CPBP family glutamic-type intramembrane protease n=1 Tax=Pelotomaculum propionicicum TaxID=258475 RepID=UPI001FA9C725|nr:CPBP family glutamic-type intramembrane protease [Pelotomaculum propionicicum]